MEQETAVPDEEAPREIQHDAIAELERIHEEQVAGGGGYDPSYGMGAAVSSFPLDEPEVHRRQGQAIPSSRDLKTLEDLYDAYPEIGNGNYYLRVERKHPTRYSGHYIAGFIADLHEQLSMSEFVQRFGGEVYEVSVRGPGRSSTLDNDGRVPARTLMTITVKVPGMPVMNAAEGGTPVTATGFGGREDPRIAMKRMDHDADALRRSEAREQQLRNEMRGRSNLSPELVAEMNRMAEVRAKETRSQATEIITDLREQIRRLTEALREREQGAEALREKLVTVQTDIQQRLREEESRQVRELKLQHETSLARVKDDHASTIQRIQQEHERRISEMTERNTRECESIRQGEARERDRLRDDASRREKSLQDDFARREAMHRDREQALNNDFARREESLRRDYEMRFQQLERSGKRDLEMIRSSESTKSELAQQTAIMQANLHLSEINRLAAAAESAEAQVAETQRELNKHTNKPLLQQVEETKLIAETLGLMDKKEEEFDWKKGAVSAIKDLIGKAPDIAKGLGDAREQNRMAVTRAQHAAEQAQMRAVHQRQRAVAQHGQPMTVPSMEQPQPTRNVPRPPPPPGMSAAPRTWDSGPPEPGHDGNLPPEPTRPPIPEAPPPKPQAGQAQQSAPPPITGGEGPLVQEDRPPTPPTPPASAEPQPTEAPTPPPEVPRIQVTEEQVGAFSEKLEAAISSGIISPGTFADGFIAETSPETALAIVNAIAPEDLVAAVASQPGAEGAAIVTREGRKFVSELWDEARQRALAKIEN